MKLVKFEFLKVVTSKLFITLFLILTSLNFLFLSYENYTASKGVPYSAYKSLESDLKDKSIEQKGEFIEQEYERVYGIDLIYHIQNNLKSENPGLREYGEALKNENKELYNKYYNEAKANPKFKYTGQAETELSFLNDIKNKYDRVSNYKGVIGDIIEEADNLQGVSIFKESSDDISMKNITRTTDAYKSMLDTKLSFEIDKGMDLFTSVTLTDFFVIIIIFILATILITEEKEKNLFTIIKSTKNGGMKTICSKIVALFLLVIFVSMVFYGMNFLYYLLTVGYGNLGSNIQSMEILILSTLKINIGGYLMLFIISKIFVLFLIASVIFYFTVKFNNSSETIISTVIIILISFIAFMGINYNSNINLLKYFNLIGLIDVNNAYRIYDNLQLGNLLYPKSSILIIFQVLLVFLILILSIVKYMRSMSITAKENRILSYIKNIKILSNIRLSHVFSFETYKLLFVNKAFIVILLFALFSGINYKNQNFNIPANELFYKSYMEVLEGKLTKEKETMIEKSRAEYDEAYEQLAKIEELIEEGKLSVQEGSYAKMPYEDIIATENTFMRIEEKYEYIKEHPEAEFVYDTGYNKLFRINNKTNENDVYLIIVTIISLIGLIIMEYRTGFIHILNATKNGRKITARKKVFASILCCTLLYLISMIPEILYIHKTYGFASLSSSIISISHFSSLPSSITILGYFILFYLLRYVSYIMIILLVLYIAIKLKNQVFAFIVSFGVLLLPFLLNMLKFTGALQFPFVNLSWIIEENIRLILLPTIVVIMIFLYNRTLKRLE